MNRELARKILKEIEKFSDSHCAITDDLGEVLARTKNFPIEHGQLNIKSRRAIKLFFQKEGCGFLYLDEDEKKIRETGKILKSIAEIIIQQEKYTQILTADEKKIDRLVYDFFFLDDADLEDVGKILKSFQVDIEKGRVASLVEISDPDYLRLFDREAVEGEREKIVTKTRRQIEYLLGSFYTRYQDNFVFYLGDRKFLVLKDMGPKPQDYQEEFKKTLNNFHYNLKSELATEITVGVGNFSPGAFGVRESFREARTALQFGKQIWGEGQIFHYDNFGVIAPLFRGANEKNMNFSIDIITKIKENGNLIKTARRYLENDMSLSKTARQLKIHRNTLVYRLDRIEELTGLDPKVFEDAFQLYMALILERYRG